MGLVRGWRSACVGVLAAIAAAGCARTASPGGDVAAGDLTRPAVELGGLGLEVRGWLVDDRDQRLGRALWEHERRGGLGAAGDAAWRSCGVRVLDVGVDALPGLFGSLAVGPERRLWLGQASRWTEAYGGPESCVRTGLRMPEGELELMPGTLRLLVRCWVERHVDPGRDRRVLRVDLLPQNRERVRSDLTLEPVDPTQPLEAGLTFERLRTGWSSDGTRALVLVPAPPEEDWEAIARRVGPQDDQGRPVGPEAPRLPTLGEAIFTPGREGFRVVLVLIPRTAADSGAGGR